MNYTTLYGFFTLTSLLLSNALILMARFVRQVQLPPSDADFEILLQEKDSLETQLTQEQRTTVGLKASIEQLETDLKRMEESLKAKTGELEILRDSSGMKSPA